MREEKEKKMMYYVHHYASPMSYIQVSVENGEVHDPL